MSFAGGREYAELYAASRGLDKSATTQHSEICLLSSENPFARLSLGREQCLVLMLGFIAFVCFLLVCYLMFSTRLTFYFIYVFICRQYVAQDNNVSFVI